MYFNKPLLLLLLLLFYRSDCAGSYASGGLLVPIRHIDRLTGIYIKRYDFSEPQAGKGLCDRSSAHKKSHVNRFLNQGNDFISAEQVKKALEWHGGVRSVVPYVVEYPESAGKCLTPRIPDVSLLHNYQYCNDGLKVWKGCTFDRSLATSGDCFISILLWSSPGKIEKQSSKSLLSSEPVSDDWRVKGLRSFFLALGAGLAFESRLTRDILLRAVWYFALRSFNCSVSTSFFFARDSTLRPQGLQTLLDWTLVLSWSSRSLSIFWRSPTCCKTLNVHRSPISEVPHSKQMVSFPTALPALLTGVLGDRRIRGDPEEMLIRNS